MPSLPVSPPSFKIVENQNSNLINLSFPNQNWSKADRYLDHIVMPIFYIITFATLWFLEHALQNDQNAPIRDLCYRHP
jgi:hypothetical protein